MMTSWVEFTWNRPIHLDDPEILFVAKGEMKIIILLNSEITDQLCSLGLRFLLDLYISFIEIYCRFFSHLRKEKNSNHICASWAMFPLSNKCIFPDMIQ